MIDLYKALGVPRNAKQARIRKAYIILSKVHHPDAGGSADDFNRINTAYKVLSDPKLRDKYNKTGQIPINEAVAQTKMLSFLAKVFGDVLKSDHIKRKQDIVKVMRELVEIHLDKLKANEKGIKAYVEILEDVKNNVKREDDRQNLFEAVALEEIGKRKKVLNDLDNDIQVYSLVSEELKSYKTAKEFYERVSVVWTSTSATNR